MRRVPVPDISILGEFEQVVLPAILRLGDHAHAVSIRDEILECTGRDVARGSIYITLDRLETKGYLRSRLADPTPERGGRSKRYYSLRPKAIDALKEGRRALVAPWRASKACWRDRSAAARRRRAAGGAGAFVSRDPRRSARRAARQLTVPLG